MLLYLIIAFYDYESNDDENDDKDDNEHRSYDNDYHDKNNFTSVTITTVC